MTIEIYGIYNKKAAKYYVGSSVNIESRLKQHLSMLEKGIHHSVKLQRSWDKYDDKNVFKFIILEELDNDTALLIKEQEWLDKKNSYYNGYNSCAIVENPLHSGKKKSVVQKKKDANERKRIRELKKMHEEEELLYYKERFYSIYQDVLRHPSIFIRQSTEFQLTKKKGNYYEYQDFLFFYNMIDLFFNEFDSNKYSLSLWRNGASISKGQIDNSFKDNIEVMVDYGYVLTVSHNIRLAYQNDCYVDFWHRNAIKRSREIDEREKLLNNIYQDGE